jgi:hypothetical protein
MAKGRKRNINVKRTASGRASRAGAVPANMEAILTRMRIFGLSEQDARDQKAATFVGRMNLMDKKALISNAQYDAAVAYLELRDKYLRAIAAPNASKQSGGATSGMSSDEHAAWCQNAKAKFDAAQAAVMLEQGLHENRGANMFAALDYLVVRDEQHWHMVGDCRLALNALAHHFGLLSKSKKPQMAA